MKNLFQDAFIESLDKESNPGIMHLKDIEAKKAGKDSFKLGNKTFPVKEKKKQIEDEGNAFGQAVQNTPKGQEIKIHGHDTGEIKKENDKKWIQHAHVKKGGLHKALHVPQGEKIPAAKLSKALHSKNSHVKHMAQFAKNVQKETIKEHLAMGLEAKPATPPPPAPAPAPKAPSDDEQAWTKSLDPKTDPKAFDAASNPSLKLDTEGVAKAREWIKKLDDMATFINGVDENSLNAQINALEMRNSIPFKGIVRREEKRITKLAENLRGLAELFKTVVTSSGKKIHDATSKITTR
jgi:hypothetical protein